MISHETDIYVVSLILNSRLGLSNNMALEIRVVGKSISNLVLTCTFCSCICMDKVQVGSILIYISLMGPLKFLRYG